MYHLVSPTQDAKWKTTDEDETRTRDPSSGCKSYRPLSCWSGVFTSLSTAVSRSMDMMLDERGRFLGKNCCFPGLSSHTAVSPILACNSNVCPVTLIVAGKSKSFFCIFGAQLRVGDFVIFSYFFRISGFGAQRNRNPTGLFHLLNFRSRPWAL